MFNFLLLSTLVHQIVDELKRLDSPLMLQQDFDSDY